MAMTRLDTTWQRHQRARMVNLRICHVFVLPCVLAAFGSLLPGTIQASEVAGRHIDWSDLRPEGQGEDNSIFPGMAGSRAQGETLSRDLTGIAVRIEGYVLPIDRDQNLVYEFLLVPWLGACSHTPQPPPNQMVHVIPSVPFGIDRAYEFVSVLGTLRPELEKTQLFIMDGPTVLTSGYGIGKAFVEKRVTPPTAALPSSNPWKLLTR